MAPLSSHAAAIAIDSSDRIYVAGAGRDSWVVRKSTDLGVTWSTVDEQFEDQRFYAASSVAIDSSGAVFAAGVRGYDSSSPRWMIRGTSDQGSTWSTVSTTVPSVLLAAGPSGSLYSSAGQMYGAIDKWKINKSIDSGVNWTSVDSFSSSGANSVLSALAVAPTGTLYTAGYSSDGTSTHWLVRRSHDSGATWTTMDDFSPSGTYGSLDHLVVGPHGEVIVSGQFSTEDFNSRWIMRKSLDQGATWAGVTGPDESAFAHTGIEELLLTPASNLFVTGYSSDKNYHGNWYLRRSTDLGASWTELASAPYSGNFISTSSAIDSTGNLYLVGREYGGWSVKKLGVSGGKLQTMDSFEGALHWTSEYPTQQAYCY
jgi:hypothetical protein